MKFRLRFVNRKFKSPEWSPKQFQCPASRHLAHNNTTLAPVQSARFSDESSSRCHFWFHGKAPAYFEDLPVRKFCCHILEKKNRSYAGRLCFSRFQVESLARKRWMDGGKVGHGRFIRPMKVVLVLTYFRFLYFHRKIKIA